jgi:hypoxanthine phosphoribosyltransferase
MRIKTLDNHDFDDACRALAEMIENSGFHPDLIVGIATGGDYVAERLQRHMHPTPALASIRLQRPSTKAKAGILSRIVSHLPRPICDTLRIIESKILAITDRRSPSAIPQISIPDKIKDAIAAGAKRILIADDAVDSGHTMLTVAKTLQTAKDQVKGQAQYEANNQGENNNKPEIKTAAITQTRTTTLLKPDYTLMPTPTIVRFPWAPDA